MGGKQGFWSDRYLVGTGRDVSQLRLSTFSVDGRQIAHWDLLTNSTEPIFYYSTDENSCKGERIVHMLYQNFGLSEAPQGRYSTVVCSDATDLLDTHRGHRTTSRSKIQMQNRRI
jgi:hypothetical protein